MCMEQRQVERKFMRWTSISLVTLLLWARCLGLGTASGCGAVQMGEVERCLDGAKIKKGRIFSTERSDIALKPAQNQCRHVEVIGML